jgi:hypothetical protein
MQLEERVKITGFDLASLSTNAIRCPVCDGLPAHIYRCSHCGEVRCGQDGCAGSEHTNTGWASSGSQCRHCRMGRYQAMDPTGGELAEFTRNYRLQQRIQPLRSQLHTLVRTYSGPTMGRV